MSVAHVVVAVEAYIVLLLGRCCVGSNQIAGEVVAYADLNYDQFTDLVVKSAPNTLDVYLAKTEEGGFRLATEFNVKLSSSSSNIVNVAVGDFDGDSFPDLLVSSTNSDHWKDEGEVEVRVCYGLLTGFQCDDDHLLRLSQQPMVMDCDCDQISDFFSVVHGRRVCFHGSKGRRMDSRPFLVPNDRPARKLKHGASHALVDITGDLSPEVILFVQSNASESSSAAVDIETWTMHSKDRRWEPLSIDGVPMKPVNPPLLSATKLKVIHGPSVFDDFDADGSIEHLIPYCTDDQCQSMYLAVWHKNVWHVVELNLTDDHGGQWHAKLNSWGVPEVHSGDYTQNGYPDLLMVLSGPSNENMAFLIENIPCGTIAYCLTWGRRFTVAWNPIVADDHAVITASFFDLLEDGTLDILIISSNFTGHVNSYIVSSKTELDASFLKVEVYTATCSNHCPNGKHGSGIALPGATVRYIGKDAEGRVIQGSFTQMSRSTFRSLVLPYKVFGLGRTPNFVDKLKVGVPDWSKPRRSWSQIVPNSRLYVIPYPANSTSFWTSKLYVTPSRLILLSVVALSGVFVAIVLVVAVLHLVEKHEDKKEKELQKRKFYFDM